MTTYPLQHLLPAFLFGYLLVFTRVGAAISLLPGIGDPYVPPRIRLVIALGVSFLVTPILAASLPPAPANMPGLFLLLFNEIFIGVFLGLVARVLFAALETAGAIIAMQINLSSALVFNPGAQTEETLPASFYTTFAVVMMFATGSYQLLLRAIVDSYNSFPAGVAPPFDDMSIAMTQTVSASFKISMELGAPYLVLATVFYILLGLIGRVMPQLQIFYLGIPAQVLAGLVMLLLTMPASILWFLDRWQSSLTNLAAPH